MAKKRPPRRRPPVRATRQPATPLFPTEPELVVIARAEAELRSLATMVEGPRRAAADRLTDVLRAAGARLQPIFGATEIRARNKVAALAMPHPALPDLGTFYMVEAPTERLPDLASTLLRHPAIEAAFLKPGAEPAMWLETDAAAPAMLEAPPATPNFTDRQGYLNVAPEGIDARYAWTRAGGRGAGIRLIDIEGAWRFSHEDLLQNQGGVIGGTQSTDLRWRNHGTAVVGEFGGDDNGFGVTGICPDANVRAISIFGGTGSAGAIRQAADALSAGDVILIELHRPGPRHNFEARDDQGGYIAVEWWPDDFAAILYATSRGVIVVEAAGNGAENLDAALYNTRPVGFPATWRNPFNRANPQCGAIVVGAGAPPPGTHGRNHGADRSRLAFSNFGTCLDVQGWGREVTTTGGRHNSAGDLQGGPNEDIWYTDQFSGTSSASPIVVGALGCLQGILRAAGRPLLTPATARDILRSIGSPQQDEPGRPATQRIGNRPDLRQAIGRLLPKLTKEIIKDKDLKDQRKETKEIKETKEVAKDLKDQRKELKDKELKDKELKDVKEREGGLQPPGTPEALATTVEDRIERLERAVEELTHFITGELRPDLLRATVGTGTSSTDPSERLQREAAEAKDIKDTRDV